MKGSISDKIKYLSVIIFTVVFCGFSSSVYAHSQHEINFYDMIEHNGSVMLLIDSLTGNIIHANQAATEFYGYSANELESMNMTQITGLSVTEIRKRVETAIEEDGSYFIMEHTLANGEKRTVEVYACPHKIEEETLLFATIYDITEKIALQKKNKLISNILIITFLSASIIAGAFIIVLFLSQRKLKEQTKRIEYLSYHDTLITGLHNRLFFEEELHRLDKPENLPLSVIIGDVNGLKLTNDIFGHDAGDMLLKKVAEIFQKVCSNEDIIARIGGDEFIILLPKKGNNEAEEIVNKVRHLFSLEKIKAIEASISMGWHTKLRENEDIHEVINIADEKMYEAKVLDREKSRISTKKSIIDALHRCSPEEERHSKDVSRLCEEVGKALKLSDMDIRKLREAGFLHDIGKIVLGDELLDRYGDYTQEQKKKIRQHPITGYRILNSFDETLDIAGLVLAHHEYWDGSGYPKGLKGQEIPFLARIIAAAEYYDVILNKPGNHMGNKKYAVSKLRKKSGIKFDPQIVEVLCSIIEDEPFKLPVENELPITAVIG